MSQIKFSGSALKPDRKLPSPFFVQFRISEQVTLVLTLILLTSFFTVRLILLTLSR